MPRSHGKNMLQAGVAACCMDKRQVWRVGDWDSHFCFEKRQGLLMNAGMLLMTPATAGHMVKQCAAAGWAMQLSC